MQPLRQFKAKSVSIPAANIDTDQIIPARFLKVTIKEGLGQHLFSDWRYTSDGQPNPNFVLNQALAEGAQILLAGDNFGCGSSREHAPWALVDYGFRAIVSTSFADIFRNNATKNGLLPIVVSAEVHQDLSQQVGAEWSVDLESCVLRDANGNETPFAIDPFSRTCLLRGQDELDFILSHQTEIENFERKAS
ncbi:MAG: 3-isopropylmalate dehydratase small subunit [Acidobacteria bacterium]|nr:3-isopropylmalate dehydratase small subunit [Acidobacteriota bacterium]